MNERKIQLNRINNQRKKVEGIEKYSQLIHYHHQLYANPVVRSFMYLLVYSSTPSILLLLGTSLTQSKLSPPSHYYTAKNNHSYTPHHLDLYHVTSYPSFLHPILRHAISCRATPQKPPWYTNTIQPTPN